MKKVFNKIKNLINAVLFPAEFKCLICGEEIKCVHGIELCESCKKELPKIKGKVCEKCSEPLTSQSKYCLACKRKLPKFTFALAPFAFEGNIAKLIKELKYDGKKYVSQTLGYYLAECYVNNDLTANIVMPIPLYQTRQAERGYNQALLLANELNKRLELPVDTESLIRVKDTQTQTNLTRVQRDENMAGAFKVVNRAAVKGKAVLLIDDVYTTGSTLNEAAKVLKSAGATKVYCITVAHTALES